MRWRVLNARAAAIAFAIAACCVLTSVSERASAAQDSIVDRILQERCDGLLPLVRPEADASKPKALESLAIMTIRGCDVDQDDYRASALMKSAMSRGANDAIARGYLALLAPGHPKDTSSGIALLARAANADVPFAAYLLAVHFWDADTPADQRRANEWAAAGARQGDTRLKAGVAVNELWGIGTRRDVAHAIMLLQEPELSETPLALLYLGGAYHDGVGVAADAAKGLALLKRAATHDAEAKLSLFRAYLNDRNWPVIAADGERLLTGALKEEPHAEAAAYLGVLYYGNMGVPANLPRAIALLQESAAAGNPVGEEYLGYVYLYGNAVSQDVPKARLLLQKAAAGGRQRAADTLAALNQAPPNATITAAYIAQLMQAYMPGYGPMTSPYQTPTGQLPLPGSPSDMGVRP